MWLPKLFNELLMTVVYFPAPFYKKRMNSFCNFICSVRNVRINYLRSDSWLFLTFDADETFRELWPLLLLFTSLVD